MKLHVWVSHLRADQVSQRSKSDSQNRLRQGGSSPKMTVREEGGGNLFSRQPAPPHWAAPACTPTHSSLSHTTCTCMCPSNPSLLTSLAPIGPLLKLHFAFSIFLGRSDVRVVSIWIIVINTIAALSCYYHQLCYIVSCGSLFSSHFTHFGGYPHP